MILCRCGQSVSRAMTWSPCPLRRLEAAEKRRPAPRLQYPPGSGSRGPQAYHSDEMAGPVENGQPPYAVFLHQLNGAVAVVRLMTTDDIGGGA